MFVDVSRRSRRRKPKSQRPVFEVPVYTRDVLEFKLENLEWAIDWLLRNFRVAYNNLIETRTRFREVSKISSDTLDRFDRAFSELVDTVLDAVDEMIINDLQLDVDVGKYGKARSVKPKGSERILGVALLREGETVKPVVVWTDYSRVGYYEVD